MTIINCSFINNNGRWGGAIDNDGNNTRIINCIFINNNASRMGGAIINYGDNMYVINSTFTYNNASTNGGAIYNYGGIDVNVINSIFTYNKAEYGGAICINGDNTKISNCNFTNNTADYGSAIFNYVNNALINNSNFIDNNLTAIYNEKTLTILNSNLTQNIMAVYSGGNITISGSNIINNYQGMLIDSTSNNTNINYNRIFNNTDYDLDNNAIITNANFNWWGSNNPNMSKIIGIIPNNYFIMNITNTTSLNSSGALSFMYIFKLNNSDSFNASLLPHFMVNANAEGFSNDYFDARFGQELTATIMSTSTEQIIKFIFATDNEIQTLEGLIIPEPEPPIPPETPIPPTPTPTPEPTNKTTNNPTANATMKTTGIPIIAILLVLLTSLGIIVRKK